MLYLSTLKILCLLCVCLSFAETSGTREKKLRTKKKVSRVDNLTPTEKASISSETNDTWNDRGTIAGQKPSSNSSKKLSPSELYVATSGYTTSRTKKGRDHVFVSSTKERKREFTMEAFEMLLLREMPMSISMRPMPPQFTNPLPPVAMSSSPTFQEAPSNSPSDASQFFPRVDNTPTVVTVTPTLIRTESQGPTSTPDELQTDQTTANTPTIPQPASPLLPIHGPGITPTVLQTMSPTVGATPNPATGTSPRQSPVEVTTPSRVDIAPSVPVDLPERIGDSDPFPSFRPTFAQTEAQRYALATFYFSSLGNQWLNNTLWVSRELECNWRGILCEAGKVRELNLPQNNIIGTIPSEIRALTLLQVFNVFGNTLHGTIPDILDQMTSLKTVDVEQNLLTGPPVVSLVGLKEIESYRVSGNLLTGSIDPRIGEVPSLKQLWLANNSKIVGSIPPQLGQLVNLESFIIYCNELTGSIPTEIGVLSNLYDFLVHDNFLTGEIPTSLYSNTNLAYFRVDENMFTGTISNQLGKLSTLRDLRIGKNILTGSLPASWINLTALQVMRLNDNSFTGTIHDSFSLFHALDFVDLSRNLFSGSIPSTIFHTPIRVLYLSNNTLSGTIPSNLGNAENLMDLYIDFNFLEGSVPAIYPGELMKLNEFTLQSNRITGMMPQSICELRGVGVLEDLWADCNGTMPLLNCSCCTRCFSL